MSRLLALGSQSIGASALASVLPTNIQGQFLLWWTGLISLPSFSCSFAIWVDGDLSLWLLRPTSLHYPLFLNSYPTSNPVGDSVGSLWLIVLLFTH